MHKNMQNVIYIFITEQLLPTICDIVPELGRDKWIEVTCEKSHEDWLIAQSATIK